MRTRVPILIALLAVSAPVPIWRLVDFIRHATEPVFTVDADPVVREDRWTPDFAESIQADLAAGRYEKLNQMATEFRQPGALFIAGWPKLANFYDALTNYTRTPLPESSCAGRADEPGFDQTRQHLVAWQTSNQNSTAAQIALNKVWLDYAWDARGCDFAYKVAPEQWALTRERQDAIENSLLDIDPDIDPEEYYLLIGNATLGGADRAQLDDFYRRAVAKFPWYLPFYGQRAIVLLKNWYGGPGEEREYLDDLRRPDAGILGQLAYTVAASELVENTYPSEFFTSDGIEFPALIAAYEVRDKQYGLRDHDWNVIFLTSLWAHDARTAHAALLQFGERWDPQVWGNHANFETNVKWFHKNSGL